MYISPEKYYAYLDDQYGLDDSSNGWYSFDCPYCGNVSGRGMAVNFEYGVVKCWNCSEKNSIVNFIIDQTGENYRSVKNMLFAYQESGVDLSSVKVTKSEVSNKVALPTGFKLLDEGDSVLANRARNYLKNRGFSIEYLSYKGFGYVDKRPPKDSEEEDYFGYLIIPMMKNSSLYYFIGRDFTDSNFLRYKNPSYEDYGVGKSELLFNEDCLDGYDTVFVTEGWACAVTMGDNSVAILGSDMSVEQRTKLIESTCSTVVVIMDRYFYSKGLKMAMGLIDYKDTVYALNLEDIDFDRFEVDESAKDPNEIGREAVLSLYYDSAPVSLGDMVKLM